MKNKGLFYSSNTIIELLILLILYYLLNKFFFLFFICIIIFFVYRSNKTSNIPLPKEIENLKMKALIENTNSLSKATKEMFIFEDKLNIPHLRNETDILVKVYSFSINPVDYFFIISRFPIIRWFYFSHFGVGMDISGKIIQVGKKVKKFKVGDEIFGFAKGGDLQEYALTNEKIIAKKPDFISFNEICCIPSCFSTAYKSLTYNFGTDVQNKKVLIIGASGGVGVLAVQIAKSLNFEKVYGICSSKNKELVKLLGADEVLCYDKENYLNECKEKFDLIFDNTYSPETLIKYEKYKKLLKPDIGEYIVINGSSIQKLYGVLQILIGKKIKIEPSHFHLNFGSQDSSYLEIAVKMLEERKLKTIYEKYDFDKKDIFNSYEISQSRRARGKLVIEINKDNK